MRRAVAIVATLVFGASLAVMPDEAAADWVDRSGDLPGMSDSGELVTGLLIIGGTTAASLAIGLTGPKPVTVDNKDGSELASAEDCDRAVEALGGEEVLVRVDQHEGKDLYGRLTCVEGGLLVHAGDETIEVAAVNVKRIEELEGSSKRGLRRRMASAIFFGGMSAYWFYYASNQEQELESTSRTLGQTMGVAFAALAATSLVLRSGPERAYGRLSAGGAQLSVGVAYVARNRAPSIVVAARF